MPEFLTLEDVLELHAGQLRAYGVTLVDDAAERVMTAKSDGLSTR